MAGTMEHLAIAWELLKKWDKIENTSLFLQGNTAPDSVMSRENYVRPMKMHTHFRDQIPDYEFSKPENLNIYHERIHQWVDSWWKKEDKNRDLYLGYLVHTLTDEHFMLTVRPEFMKKIAVLGLTEKDAQTFVHFTYDVNHIDFRLAKEYAGMSQVCEEFRHMKAHEIPGMVSAEEMKKSNQWLVDFYFDKRPEIEQPIYYTYERALRFIGETTDLINEKIDLYLS